MGRLGWSIFGWAILNRMSPIHWLPQLGHLMLPPVPSHRPDGPSHRRQLSSTGLPAVHSAWHSGILAFRYFGILGEEAHNVPRGDCLAVGGVRVEQRHQNQKERKKGLETEKKRGEWKLRGLLRGAGAHVCGKSCDLHAQDGYTF